MSDDVYFGRFWSYRAWASVRQAVIGIGLLGSAVGCVPVSTGVPDEPASFGVLIEGLDEPSAGVPVRIEMTPDDADRLNVRHEGLSLRPGYVVVDEFDVRNAGYMWSLTNIPERMFDPQPSKLCLQSDLIATNLESGVEVAVGRGECAVPIEATRVKVEGLFETG